MNEFAKKLAGMSPKRLAVLAMELQAKVEALERGPSEPVAIIGMACRFPGGARTVSAYWELLREGRDGIGVVPPERWNIDEYYDPDPEAPGKMYSKYGGFVADIDRFDPQFFGITPREAARMDPQHRLLLEVCWEALEDAGQPPAAERGRRTGVFVGITANEYAELVGRAGLAGLDAYCMTGNALSFASGRLSYVLGLQGPSLAVDTACSSSLVAVHLACQSLRAGESRMALAAGVNVILTPAANVVLSRARMLAADGRCKTFDAAADGYVRGEGCGVVVLKRLSEARADGDRILAVIRGSAVNQDGASGGLTVPNGVAQQAVLREALQRAGIQPCEVDYVEAHGTGTSLGDPIEIEAVGAVLGDGRAADRPLLIGSAKTNIGHLESSAGIAGLIKVVLALQHRQVPPHLHLTRLNPHVRLDHIPAAIPTTLTPWESRGAQRIAGISAFGASGTNAHVIVAEAPPLPEAPSIAERPYHVLTLSARTEDALRALAARYAEHLTDNDAVSLPHACYTASVGRTHFRCRAAVVGSSVADLNGALATFAARGEQNVHIRTGAVSGDAAPRIAFLFTGQGSQRIGMGRELYETQPTFRAALDRCAEILRDELPAPLLEILYPAAGTAPRLDETAYTQPALFAVEYALTELWRSWGVRPSVVVGHSVGEYVAACVAGVFSVEDALRLVAARGRLMQALSAGGAMVAVTADEERVRALMAPVAESAAIAAVNAPGQVVLAGAGETLRGVVAVLETERVPATWLPVSHAFHSPLMDPMLDAFERVASQVTYRPPALDLVSNVTGALVTAAEVTTPAYWRRHVRATVQYARGLEAAYATGCRLFLEVGPRPTLTALGRQTLTDPEITWAASLRTGRSDWHQLLEAVATLYVRGVAIDWASFDRPYGRRRVALPTYPFQRQRHWVDPSPAPAVSTVTSRQDPLHEIVWTERALSAPRATGTPLVVVFADRSGLAEALVACLHGRGAPVVVVERGRSYRAVDEHRFVIDAAESEDFATVWRDVTARAGGSELVIAYLWSLDVDQEFPHTTADDLPRAAQAGCGRLLHLLHGIARSDRTLRSRLRVVTRGAHCADAASPVALAQAPLLGLLRTVRGEYPELGCRVIDLDPASPFDPAALVAELLAEDPAEEVGFRRGTRLVPQLVPARLEPKAPAAIRSDATYLITGGLGSVGLRLARWIVEQGARHVVLAGRRAPTDRAAAVIRELLAAGANVRAVSVDVASEPDLVRVLADIEREFPPLRGIFHAAGVLDDGVLAQQTRERFDRVLAPKVFGAWYLHQHTRDRELDLFVLFSSLAGVLGSPGQGNYAAANSFLDALAYERRRLGLAAVSIAWGPWAGGGMAAAVADANRQKWAAQGLLEMDPAEALRLLERVAATDAAHVIVMPLIRDRIVGRSNAHPALDGLARAASESAGDGSSSEPPLLVRLRQCRPSRRRAMLHTFLCDLTRAVFGFGDSMPFDPKLGLRDLGMDSMTALELRNRLQHGVGLVLPSTLAFDHPTVDAMARFLADDVLVLPKPEDDSVEDLPGPHTGFPTFEDVLLKAETLSDAEIERVLAARIGVGSVQ